MGQFFNGKVDCFRGKRGAEFCQCIFEFWDQNNFRGCLPAESALVAEGFVDAVEVEVAKGLEESDSRLFDKICF